MVRASIFIPMALVVAMGLGGCNRKAPEGWSGYVEGDYVYVSSPVGGTLQTLAVRRGQAVGRVEVWSRGRLLGSRPLVAARTVSKPGIAGRAGWYARRTVHHVAGLLTP